MPAKKETLTIEQGATFVLSVVVQDSAGVAINVGGFTARMQVRETHGSAGTLLDLTSASEIAVGGTDGTFTVTVPAATTAALSPGSAVYDFEMIDGAGAVTRVLEGVAIITPEVTR